MRARRTGSRPVGPLFESRPTLRMDEPPSSGVETIPSGASMRGASPNPGREGVALRVDAAAGAPGSAQTAMSKASPVQNLRATISPPR